jgi:hypothetical protein
VRIRFLPRSPTHLFSAAIPDEPGFRAQTLVTYLFPKAIWTLCFAFEINEKEVRAAP